jgi:glycosyltransferase 2 family protein
MASRVDTLKRVGILLVQLLVTAAGLWYVFHDPQKRAQIAVALKHADRIWLILGWLCYSVVEILATVRWQILLRIQGIRLRWLRAGAIVMIGLFFNQFLPGGIGGDAMRLYFVFKLVPGRKVGATLSIAMDRLLGLLTLLFLAGMSLSLRFKALTRSSPSLHIVYLALGLLGASFAFVVLLFWLASVGLLSGLPRATPFRKVIIDSGEALLRYRAHLLTMAFAFLITVVAHLAYYTSYYFAGESLHASGHAAGLADILSIMPLVDTIVSVPISLGGVGVRETLFQELLGNLSHVPPALAAFTGSLGFVNQAAWGLVGAAIFLASQKIISR